MYGALGSTHTRLARLVQGVQAYPQRRHTCEIELPTELKAVLRVLLGDGEMELFFGSTVADS